MRPLKIIGLVLLGAALLAGAGAAAVVAGGAPLAARLIETAGSARLGREIRLGRLDIAWGSPIHVTAENVRVANAAWGSGPDLFSSERLELDLDAHALLRLRLTIPRLELTRPALRLESSAEDGKRNWEGVLGGPRGGGSVSVAPELRRLVVHQGRFTYRNGRTAAETDLAVDELVAGAPDRTRPVAVEAGGSFERQPFAFKAELAPLAELRGRSWPSPVRLDGHLGTNTVTLTGAASDPLALQGLDLRVDMAGEDLQQLLATLGVPIPRVPIYRLAGHLKRDGARWDIEDLAGVIGHSQLAGGVLVDAGQPVPYIRADLTASYLELADLKGLYGGEPGAAPPRKEAKKDARLVPDFRMPVERLRGFNADFSLDAPRVKPSAGIPFERVSFGVSLHDGDLRVRGARLAVADGEVRADLEYRSTDRPPRFRADVEMRRVDLRRLFAGMDVSPSLKRTSGLAGGFAKLRSSGETQRQIFAGLDGEIGLFLKDGRLGGKPTELFDLRVAEALGLAGKDDGPRPVRCLVGRFAVKSGIATAETLLLDTPSAVVAGLGNANLADETLFLDLKPYPRKGGDSLGGVRVPVAIRGTFADPTFAADKTGLIERLGAAVGLAPVAIPATLLPFLSAGLGDDRACSELVARGREERDGTGAAGALEGSSTPPRPQKR